MRRSLVPRSIDFRRFARADLPPTVTSVSFVPVPDIDTVQMSSSDESVDQFCAITGADRDLAVRMLEACGGSLEMAVVSGRLYHHRDVMYRVSKK